MSAYSWHAFFYESLDTSKPPVRSDWIEADREEDAIRIVKKSLGRGECVELTRPRWEGSFTPIIVKANGEKAQNAAV